MLTEKDRLIYEIQDAYQRLHGVAPTIREIARLYGTPSWSHVLDSLERLVAAGLLNKVGLERQGIYRPTIPADEVNWEEYLDGKDKEAG